MLYTTLNKIRACRPCKEGWTKLLTNLGKTEADDEPLGFDLILASNGIDDALWCCRAAPEYNKIWQQYSAWCGSDTLDAWTAAWDACDTAADAAWDACKDMEGDAASTAASVKARADIREAQKTQFVKMLNEVE